MLTVGTYEPLQPHIHTVSVPQHPIQVVQRDIMTIQVVQRWYSGGTGMVQEWYSSSVGLVQGCPAYRGYIRTSTAPHTYCECTTASYTGGTARHHDDTGGTAVVQRWYRNGTGVVQQQCRVGTGLSCLPWVHTNLYSPTCIL